MTTIAIIEALQRVGDEETASEIFEQWLRTRIEATVVDETYFPEYRTAVAKALDVGTESVPRRCLDAGELKAPFHVGAEAT